jgi:hypothetical protein
VCTIILLFDGMDSHNFLLRDGSAPDYAPLVPRSIHPGSENHVPIHAFGFSMDHDSRAMHAVAQMSNGTFSFIDMVGSIQDAFAQCIGGLLSVVAQETSVAFLVWWRRRHGLASLNCHGGGGQLSQEHGV